MHIVVASAIPLLCYEVHLPFMLEFDSKNALVETEVIIIDKSINYNVLVDGNDK